MYKREMKTILSFASTSDAMAAEEKCKEEGLPGRLIPVPSVITAGCGLAWASPILYKDEVIAFFISRKLNWDKVTDLEL